MTGHEDADRATGHSRWRVWGLVPLAASLAALSAFTDPAVRTAEHKFGAQGVYGLDVRVWGMRLHQERVVGTPEVLHTRAEARALQWRWGLAAASALAGGGAVGAAVAWGHRRRGGAVQRSGRTRLWPSKSRGVEEAERP
jgi:hypothetical protein